MNNWKRQTYISSPSRNRLPSKRRKSTFWPIVKNFFHLYRTGILVVIIITLITTIIQLAYTYTIGKQENIINEIVFTDESVQMYDNKELYNFIRNELKNKNVVMLRVKKGGESKDIIKQAYPFIEDFSIEKIGPSKISVNMEFSPAEVVFKNGEVNVGYANKFLFTVNDNNAITSGAIFVRLPDYFSGETIQQSVTGYISLIGPEKIKTDLMTIKEQITINEILFLIGSQKSIIDTGNKRLTFDHKRSIKAQLEYFKTMQTLDPAFFYEIDLTTYPTVIIRKREGGMPPL